MQTQLALLSDAMCRDLFETEGYRLNVPFFESHLCAGASTHRTLTLDSGNATCAHAEASRTHLPLMHCLQACQWATPAHARETAVSGGRGSMTAGCVAVRL